MPTGSTKQALRTSRLLMSWSIAGLGSRFVNFIKANSYTDGPAYMETTSAYGATDVRSSSVHGRA